MLKQNEDPYFLCISGTDSFNNAYTAQTTFRHISDRRAKCVYYPPLQAANGSMDCPALLGDDPLVGCLPVEPGQWNFFLAAISISHFLCLQQCNEKNICGNLGTPSGDFTGCFDLFCSVLYK